MYAKPQATAPNPAPARPDIYTVVTHVRTGRGPAPTQTGAADNLVDVVTTKASPLPARGSTRSSSAPPSPAALGDAAARLTDRDHDVLASLALVRVLTNPQIARLWFRSERTGEPGAIAGRHRMLKLAELGVVHGFRPLRPGGGSHPVHYALTPLGAHIAATARGADPEPARRAAKSALERIAAGRAYITHAVGVSALYVGLRIGQRDGLGEIERWYPHAETEGLYKSRRLVPDALTIWRPAGARRRIGIALEVDAGTERLAVIEDKARRYWHGHTGSSYSRDALEYDLGRDFPPLLLVTAPSSGREHSLAGAVDRAVRAERLGILRERQAEESRRAERFAEVPALLADDGRALPGATAVWGPDADPLAPIWRPLGAVENVRLALAELGR